MAERLRNLAGHAATVVRRIDGVPRPRPIAATGAMLVLIGIAGSYQELTDKRARQPLEAVAATAIPSAAVESVALAPVLVSTSVTHFDELRSPIPQVSAAMALSRPVAAPGSRRPRSEARAIQAVLNRYRDAFSILDVTAVTAVWPSADVSAVRREFASLVEQNVEFEACRISSAGRGATASCAGVIESGFRAGNRRPRLERKRWQFTLHKVRERWMITAVGTRPA